MKKEKEYFKDLPELPNIKLGSKTRIFYHEDECDCIECQARTEPGGLDHDPSNDNAEFEEHERQVMRDTGIDEEAEIKQQISDCEQDIRVMEGKLENESILPLERERLKNDIESWKGEHKWLNQKLKEIEVKKNKRVPTFQDAGLRRVRRKLFWLLSKEIVIGEGAKKEAEDSSQLEDAMYAQGRIDGVQKAVDILKKVWVMEDVSAKVNQLLNETTARYGKTKQATDVVRMRGEVDGARFAHDMICELSS